jgi:DNA-binding MarR family transcriptional regulator
MDSNQYLFELIERIGNLLRTEDRRLGHSHGLQPVHIQALDYLSRCNHMSDTPLALSQFLGISKGTTSQSLLVLQNKGYIKKSPDKDDRRVVHLQLSPKGNKLLDHFNYPDSGLPAAEQDATAQALSRILRSLIEQQQGKSFGVCHSCRHFQQQGKGYHCGLIGAALQPDWIDNICHEHQYP